MRYNIYRPLTYSIMKANDSAAKRALSKADLKMYKKMNTWRAYSMLARQLGFDESVIKPLITDIDSILLRFEHLWAVLNDGFRLVMFPASSYELSMIQNSSFKNVNINDIDNTIFSVGVNDDAAGYNPFLVALCDCEKILQADNFIFDELNISEFGISRYRPEGKRVLAVATSEKVNIDGQNGYMYSVEFVGDSDFNALLESRTFADWNTHIGGRSLQGTAMMSEQEREEIWRLCKLAVNMLLYKHVFPEKVCVAPPPVSARNTMGKMPIKAIYAGDKSSHSEGGAITVGYHMRCLRHERYYRDEKWKSKPRGSRWVPVESYIKGGKSEILKE